MTRRDLAHVLSEPHYAVRALVLLGAPHEGQGRDVTFDAMGLAAWCEAGARAASDPESATRWHRRALRLAAHASRD